MKLSQTVGLSQNAMINWHCYLSLVCYAYQYHLVLQISVLQITRLVVQRDHSLKNKWYHHIFLNQALTHVLSTDFQTLFALNIFGLLFFISCEVSNMLLHPYFELMRQWENRQRLDLSSNAAICSHPSTPLRIYPKTICMTFLNPLCSFSTP